jgi:hypothetical protein
MNVRLAADQRSYLLAAEYLPSDLRSLVPREGNLEITRETADRFQDAFTKRLAVAGFDGEYEPTTEGELLEDLIDLFSPRPGER